MKKIIFALLIALGQAALGGTAYAANGDIAGKIYTTDILTQIDGRDIPSYAIDGETLIAVEDLEAYGFNVKYDDSIRTVFVNHTGECPSDFNPSVPRGKVGGISGYYYESDIRTCVNGRFVEAYSLNGKMAARVEDLGKVTEESKYGVSAYLMTYNWDEGNRLLSLYTAKDKLPDVETIKDDYINNDSYLWFFDKEIPTGSGCVLVGGQSGTPHGTYYNYKFLRYSDKLYMNLYDVLYAYEFYDYWGRIKIDNLRADGDKLIFDGQKFDGRYGTYCLDLLTFEMTYVGEEQYDPDKSVVEAFPESPEGKPIETSGVNVEIDKKPVQAYSGKNLFSSSDSHTYIEADALLHFGFTKTETDKNIIYAKTGKTDEAWNDTIRPAGEEIGTVAFCDKEVTINGCYTTAYNVGGKILIDADNLRTPDPVNKVSYQYPLYGRYGLSTHIISGKYIEETNTLSLDTSGYTDVYFDTLKETVRKRIYALPDIYTQEDVNSVVWEDTENCFIITHTLKEYDGADCYAVVSEDGKYGKAYYINEWFAVYGVYDINEFSYDNNAITAKTKYGDKYSLDLQTLAVIKR